MSTVRMTHPHLPGQAIEVAESAVPIHRASGWRTDDDATPAAAAAPEKQPEHAAAPGRRSTTSGKE